MAEEETMETEEEKKNPETGETATEEEEGEVDEAQRIMIEHLVGCEDVFFKSQQRGEADLTREEKASIARKVWLQSKSGFLCRFGRHLQEEHLQHFRQFEGDERDGYAVAYYLGELRRFFSKAKRERDVRNRRFEALGRLLRDSSHFSEVEMMRRQPLLYHQLVGQYLSDEERKQRDNIDTKNITFVNLLLESIDRDTLRKKQQEQRDNEEYAMEQEEEEDEEDDKEDQQQQQPKEEDSDSWDEEPTDKVTKWGEFPGSSTSYISEATQARRYEQLFAAEAKPSEVVVITAAERNVLKEEFISIMYQDFLDGKDPDFDYATVDDNEEYDNLELRTHDAEDSYFDSETPEDVPPDRDALPAAEEDALDVFMSRLNNHPTVQQLSERIHNL